MDRRDKKGEGRGGEFKLEDVLTESEESKVHCGLKWPTGTEKQNTKD